MKNALVGIAMMFAITELTTAQNINWRSLQENQRNVIQLNVGYDYGVTSQFGYGRIFDIVKPVLVMMDFSAPMGERVVDDFKLRVGAQIEILELGNFSTTVKIQSHLRRYENELVRIVGFGSDFGLVSGYFKPTWYAAGEFGFDKSIVSHLKHSDVMKENFPGIRDGWFIPSGGNFYYGIQGGKTLGETLELSLRLGATTAQGSDENAVMPYYAQLGIGVRL